MHGYRWCLLKFAMNAALSEYLPSPVRGRHFAQPERWLSQEQKSLDGMTCI